MDLAPNRDPMTFLFRPEAGSGMPTLLVEFRGVLDSTIWRHGGAEGSGDVTEHCPKELQAELLAAIFDVVTDDPS